MKYVKLFFRLLLGAFMVYAGFSHLTFNRRLFSVRAAAKASELGFDKARRENKWV